MTNELITYRIEQYRSDTPSLYGAASAVAYVASVLLVFFIVFNIIISC